MLVEIISLCAFAYIIWKLNKIDENQEKLAKRYQNWHKRP